MEDVLDEIAAGRKDRQTELGEFYYGTGDVEGLKTLVTELGDIDAKELATFPIGGKESGIQLRVGRYGPYIEQVPGPDDAGSAAPKRANEIGRASCRDRVWPNVKTTGVGRSLKKKKET